MKSKRVTNNVVRNMLLWLACSVAVGLSAQVDVRAFQNPPQQARPSTYWQWMNGNITKAGLTLDLEYMARSGYGSAMIFDTGVGIPRGGVDYNSPQWTEAVEHAMREAGRMGLRLSLHNSPGYSGTGGPWIPVELSMKQLMWTDTFVVSDGREALDVRLPRPCSRQDFYRDACILAYPSLPGEVRSFWSMVRRLSIDGCPLERSVLSDHNLSTQCRMESGESLLFELQEAFELQAATLYRGEREKPLDPHDGPRDYPPVLRVEVSLDGKEFRPVGTFRCSALRAMDTPGTFSCPPVKARYVRLTTNRGTNLAEVDFHASPRLSDYAPKINAANAPVVLPGNFPATPADEAVSSGAVVDVTGRTDADGRLLWPAPPGRWTIVRIGYTTTGEVVAAAPDAGIGLECDKMSPDGVDCHLERFLIPLLERLKPWCGSTLESLVVDSWEAGKQNWTEGLIALFRQKRGYDPVPYLLAVTGRIVDGTETTERFLYDFRRTHTDLFLENYVDRFRACISRYGLEYVGEAYGDGNFESLELASRQDIPMSEFWTHYIYGNITTTMMASSVAHVLDKPVVACECYTGTPFNSKFTEHPYGMKALGDYIMTAGVNRFVYHAMAHQPYAGEQPGNIMTMGPFGTHLDRNSTWSEQFSALNLYNARCAYLLQQGHYVADVLYLKDECISSGVRNYNMDEPVTPYGYRWDVTLASLLRERAVVRGGCLELPGGMSYRLLVVPPMERTTPETLSLLTEWVRQGLSVLLAGEPPSGYLGLDEQKDRAVRALADTLWSASVLGKGRIYRQTGVGEALREMGIRPDFAFVAEHKDAQIHFIHRQTVAEDIYFVANHRRRAERLQVACRTTGRVPRLWNAETGQTELPVEYEVRDGLTRLNLVLPESGSVFIVFSKGKQEPTDLPPVSVQATVVRTNHGDSYGFSPEHDFRSTFTLCCWVKPETFAAAGRGFLLYPDKGRMGKASVGVSVGQNGVQVVERDTGLHTVLEYEGALEGWTHLALVYDAGVPQLYVNGEPVQDEQASGRNCMPAVDVPMAEEQFIGSFEGDQTPMSVFDYALSAAEVRTEAEKGLPLPPSYGVLWRELSADWQVEFPAYSHIPHPVVLDTLRSLHRHTDFNVRHFSGTATYSKRLVLTKYDLEALKGHRVLLNLGRVENLAEVTVNDCDTQLVWKAPYVADITGKLREGDNVVVVRVTNLWPNRIIGDEHLPDPYLYDEYGRIRLLPEWFFGEQANERERVLFLPWKYYTRESPLLESGLVGPVRLELADRRGCFSACRM